MSKTSVLLADDNSAVLSHVTKMLERDYQVVGALRDGTSVLSKWTVLSPDVIILDVSMVEPNGIVVARRLRDSGCNSKVIFLTIYEDPDMIGAAMEAGGLGYVVKSRMGADLIAAIRAVLSGKLFVSSRVRAAEY